METKVSERDLAASLSHVLDRVRDGERFVVERDGQRLAVLSPPEPIRRAGVTGRELMARLGDARMPGDGFAEDVEAARSGLLPAAVPSWPD